MKKQSGSILITLLVILFCIAILIFNSMEELLLYMKVSHRRIQNIEEFYQLENIALNAQNLKNAACILKTQDPSVDDPNFVITKLRKKSGCTITINEKSYRYIIEDLGEFPCIKILNTNHGTYQWRISIMSPSNQILQMRLAKSLTTKMHTQNISCKNISYLREGLMNERKILQ